MEFKTLCKKEAIHVLNILSMVMAFGVTCFSFDSSVANDTIRLIGEFLVAPVHFTDHVMGIYSSLTVSGNFTLMFLVTWLCYAIPLINLYPLLMITSHGADELRDWYATRKIHS